MSADLPDLLPADQLREAARVLRERAEAASPGPWEGWRQHDPMGSLFGVQQGSDPYGEIVDGGAVADSDADYIATVHPGVGLALADWLDDVAAGWVWDDEGNGGYWDDGMPMRLEEAVDSRALRIADLILGGAS